MNFRDTTQECKKAVRGISPRLKIKKPWIAPIYPRLNWHPLIFFLTTSQKRWVDLGIPKPIKIIPTT